MRCFFLTPTSTGKRIQAHTSVPPYQSIKTRQDETRDDTTLSVLIEGGRYFFSSLGFRFVSQLSVDRYLCGIFMEAMAYMAFPVHAASGGGEGGVFWSWRLWEIERKHSANIAQV